jgi:hypothetical protein
MVSRIALLATLMGVTLSARADINLTPIPYEREVDGIKIPEVRFRDGKTQVSFRPPAGWTCNGTSNKATLRPANSDVEAKIEALPPIGILELNNEGMKQLRGQALAAIPEGATDVQVLTEGIGAVLVDGRETYQITVAYSFYGKSLRTGMVMLNLEAQQLIFRLGATAKDYERFEKFFWASLCSWQWLPSSPSNNS